MLKKNQLEKLSAGAGVGTSGGNCFVLVLKKIII